MTRADFFTEANRQGRSRLFNEQDYEDFLRAVADAEAASAQGKPYYAEANAGGEVNSYGYVATTACWGVWVDPHDRVVITLVGRKCITDLNVPCAYPGGIRAYHNAWKAASDVETPA